jgi:hypothetical protein
MVSAFLDILDQEGSPVAGFQRSVVIEQPLETVFDFASDLKNTPILLPNVTKAEMLTEGGMNAGAKFRETRRMKGKEHSAVIEITEYQRPDVYAARSAMMGLVATYRFRFTPEGPGTRVDLEAEVKGNLLWKLFLGMMSRMLEKEDGEMLTRMKEALEQPRLQPT